MWRHLEEIRDSLPLWGDIMVGSKVSPSIPQLVLAALLAGSSVSGRTWEGGDHHTHLSSPHSSHHITSTTFREKHWRPQWEVSEFRYYEATSHQLVISQWPLQASLVQSPVVRRTLHLWLQQDGNLSFSLPLPLITPGKFSVAQHFQKIIAFWTDYWQLNLERLCSWLTSFSRNLWFT